MRVMSWFLGLVCFPCMLMSEIVWVKVIWNKDFCTGNCANMLERRLREMKGASAVSMNPSTGSAEIAWKPHQPFTYQMITNASAWVGLQIHDTAVKVRGTITHDNTKVYLTSLGDGTRFVLLNNETPDSHNYHAYNVTQNAQQHPLSGTMRQKFLEAEQNHQVVTAEGFLFLPHRTALSIMVDRTSLDSQ